MPPIRHSESNMFSILSRGLKSNRLLTRGYGSTVEVIIDNPVLGGLILPPPSISGHFVVIDLSHLQAGCVADVFKIETNGFGQFTSQSNISRVAVGAAPPQ